MLKMFVWAGTVLNFPWRTVTAPPAVTPPCAVYSPTLQKRRERPRYFSIYKHHLVHGLEVSQIGELFTCVYLQESKQSSEFTFSRRPLEAFKGQAGVYQLCQCWRAVRWKLLLIFTNTHFVVNFVIIGAVWKRSNITLTVEAEDLIRTCVYVCVQLFYHASVVLSIKKIIMTFFFILASEFR